MISLKNLRGRQLLSRNPKLITTVKNKCPKTFGISIKRQEEWTSLILKMWTTEKNILNKKSITMTSKLMKETGMLKNLELR